MNICRLNLRTWHTLRIGNHTERVVIFLRKVNCQWCMDLLSLRIASRLYTSCDHCQNRGTRMNAWIPAYLTIIYNAYITEVFTKQQNVHHATGYMRIDAYNDRRNVYLVIRKYTTFSNVFFASKVVQSYYHSNKMYLSVC